VLCVTDPEPCCSGAREPPVNVTPTADRQNLQPLTAKALVTPEGRAGIGANPQAKFALGLLQPESLRRLRVTKPGLVVAAWSGHS
jgi:hypothetical protein